MTRGFFLILYLEVPLGISLLDGWEWGLLLSSLLTPKLCQTFPVAAVGGPGAVGEGKGQSQELNVGFCADFPPK